MFRRCLAIFVGVIFFAFQVSANPDFPFWQRSDFVLEKLYTKEAGNVTVETHYYFAARSLEVVGGGWDRECLMNMAFPNIGSYAGFSNRRTLWAWRHRHLVNELGCAPENNDEILELRFSDDSFARIPTSVLVQTEFDHSAATLTLAFTNAEIIQLPLRFSGSLGLSASNIQLNPNGTTPLSALASFSTPLEGSIKVVVPGKGPNGIAIEHTFTARSDFEIPILGLYPDHNNPVEFHFYSTEGTLLSVDIVEIPTAPISSLAPDINIVSNTLAADDSGLFMEVGSKFAFDQHGEFRWALTLPGQIFDRLDNGNWLIGSIEGMVVYHWPSFIEVDMLGNIVNSYKVPNLGHHEIFAMSTGNFLVGSNSVEMTFEGFFDTGTLQEDTVVEISSLTGDVVKEYDLNLYLDPNRLRVDEMVVDDWFHVNSAVHDESDDSVVISGRLQGVVKIARQTEELVWILAPHEEWPTELQPYLLTPVNALGETIDISQENFWPYGQHSAIVLENGNILMFDNGTNRGLYKPEGALPENLYSRAVEYKIDEQAMTIEKVWEFDYDRLIYTFATGDIDYLKETQSRLISFLWLSDSTLSTPRVIEVDSEDNIVFEYIINTTTNGYRSDKFTLYQGVD